MNLLRHAILCFAVLLTSGCSNSLRVEVENLADYEARMDVDFVVWSDVDGEVVEEGVLFPARDHGAPDGVVVAPGDRATSARSIPIVEGGTLRMGMRVTLIENDATILYEPKEITGRTDETTLRLIHRHPDGARRPLEYVWE